MLYRVQGTVPSGGTHQQGEPAGIFLFSGMIWENEKKRITNKKFENQRSNLFLPPPDGTKHKSFRQMVSYVQDLLERMGSTASWVQVAVTGIIWLLHPAC